MQNCKHRYIIVLEERANSPSLLLKGGAMSLRWNKEQADIYNLVKEGLSNKELREKGYKKPLVDKVKGAIAKGDAPPHLGEPQTPPGEPLFSATLKTKKVTLEPIVAVRYDSVRHALRLGNDYTLEQFIDESTDIITELVGAVPPGFTKEEQAEETKKEEVAVV